MKVPYICENTIVRMIDGKEGKVICVDTKTKVAIVRTEKAIHTEPCVNLSVVSYKEVM